jgi:hypothetical protein
MLIERCRDNREGCVNYCDCISSCVYFHLLNLFEFSHGYTLSARNDFNLSRLRACAPSRSLS